MTPVDATVPNIMKGVLFGKNALDEVQDYRENDQTPLSEQQTEKFKIGGRDYFQEVMDSRAADDEKEVLKALAKPSTPQAMTGSTDQRVHQLKDGTFYVPSLTSEQKTFKTEKLARQAIEEEQFAAGSDSFVDLGDRVLRRDSEGKVTPMRKDVYTEKLLTGRMLNSKKNENYDDWVKFADQKFNLLNQLILDPTVDDLDRIDYENALATLMGEYEKYQEYGGAFTKPKKGRKLEEKYRYPLVDKDLMGFTALSKAAKNPIIVKRPPVLNRRRMRKVRKARK